MTVAVTKSAAEKIDQAAGKRLWRLFGDEVATIERLAANVVSPLAPYVEHFRALVGAAGSTPKGEEWRLDFAAGFTIGVVERTVASDARAIVLASGMVTAGSRNASWYAASASGVKAPGVAHQLCSV